MVNSPFTVCPSLTQSSRRQRECAVHYVDSPRNLLICNIFSVPIIDIMSSNLDAVLVRAARCQPSTRKLAVPVAPVVSSVIATV